MGDRPLTAQRLLPRWAGGSADPSGRSRANLAAVTWWTWTILWVVLVLGGALALFLAARRLYRQGMALARELGFATDALAEVTSAMHREHPSPRGMP
jgi:hypothetical protein